MTYRIDESRKLLMTDSRLFQYFFDMTQTRQSNSRSVLHFSRISPRPSLRFLFSFV